MSKTLQEKLQAKIDEGLETARFCIRSKVGESRILCQPSSIYNRDLREQARKLELQVDLLEQALDEFLSLSTWAKDQRDRQIDLPIDREDTEQTVAEKVVIELCRICPDQEWKARATHDEADDLVEVEVDLEGGRTHTAEARGLLMILGRLEDGAGPEAVRAALLGPEAPSYPQRPALPPAPEEAPGRPIGEEKPRRRRGSKKNGQEVIDGRG